MAEDRQAAERFGGRYHGLDGLRGIAALLVAAYHIGLKTGLVVPQGYLAVDLFFALSGFVIALSYADRLRLGLPVRRFLELRFIRLAPLYLFGTALGGAKQAVGAALGDPRALHGLELILGLVCGFLMLPVPLPLQALFPFNASSWSLFMEVAINCAFALWLFRWSNTALAILMGASVLVLLWTLPAIGHFNVGWAWENIAGGFARTAFSFSAGLLFHRLLPRGTRRTSWFAVLPVLALVALLVSEPAPHLRLAYDFAVVLVAFPVLLAAGILFEPPPVLRRACAMLGDASYPIYMIHWPLVPLFAPLLIKLGLGPVASSVAFAVAMLVLGTLVSRLIDAPARGWLARHLPAPARPPALPELAERPVAG